MPTLRRTLIGLRPAMAVLLALAGLASACAPTPPAPLPATGAPAATAGLAATVVPTTTARLAATQPVATALPAVTAAATSVDLASALDADLQQSYRTGLFNGTVLVAQNGRVILSNGYGVANLAKSIPNGPQTKFRIYQLTMPFTAMAILLLQARGQLKVQDSLCKYRPNCPNAWQAVTLQQLLTHTSGIVDTWDIHARGSLTSTLPLARMITATEEQPLSFPPGTQFQFNNLGYILLGQVIETVSGQTYPAFLQQNIFGPLGMTNTGYDDNRPDVAVVYAGYGTSEGGDPVNQWVPFSAAGLYSTVGDLYIWDQALYTAKLVPPAVLDAIFTPYTPATGFSVSGFGYGYGWLIGSGNQGRLMMAADYPPGFAASLTRYPDAKATIIVLSNSENTTIYNTVASLAAKLFAR